MRFQYIFAQTLQSIRRNPLVVASAVVAVLVTLVLVFGAIVVRWSIDQDIGRWDDNVRVIAWLGDDLTVDQVTALQPLVRTQEDDVDKVMVKVEDHASHARGKDNQLIGACVRQAGERRHPIAHALHGAHIVETNLCRQFGGSLPQYRQERFEPGCR